MMPSKKIKTTIKTFSVKLFLFFLALLSLKNCHRIGSFLGTLLYIIPNRNRHITQTNIQLCFPDISKNEQKRLIKNSLKETSKTLTEASPMWMWKKDKLFSLIKSVHGEELIKEALSQKRGVILALPHLGNWELLGLYCSAQYSTTSMYQKPKLAQLDSIVKRGRERFGANLVPTDNKGIRAMLQALKKSEVVCILPDQEPSESNGVFAPFYGINAYSMTLISRLASKTNASVILAYTKRLSNAQGYEIIFSKMKDMQSETIEDSVAYVNSEMESHINKIPEQYQWSYKRFRKKLDTKENKIVQSRFYHS